MQDSLDHAERLVILCSSSPYLIDSQPHEVVMYAHQEHVQIKFLQQAATNLSPEQSWVHWVVW